MPEMTLEELLQKTGDDPQFQSLPKEQQDAIFNQMMSATDSPQEPPPASGAIVAGNRQPSSFPPDNANKHPNVYAAGQTVKSMIKPVLPTLGMLGGGIAGAPGGPVGTVVGAGLGYAAGAQAGRTMDSSEYTNPVPFQKQVLRSGREFAEGAVAEMGGQIAGKVIPPVLNTLGRGAKKGLGWVQGVTTGERGLVEQAYKSSTGKAFNAGLKGELTGEQVVDNAKGILKDMQRSAGDAYAAKLNKIANVPVRDVTPIVNQMNSQLKKFGITKTTYKNRLALNAASSPLPEPEVAQLKKIVTDIELLRDTQRLQPGTATVGEMNVLRQKMSEFMSDTENTRLNKIIVNIKQGIDSAISSATPEAREMTVEYARAQKIISRTTQDLSLGNKGQVSTALSKMTNALRVGDPVRTAFIDNLERASGQDIKGALSGMAMQNYMPKHRLGPMVFLTSDIFAAISRWNPNFLLLLAASSPRVTAQFIQVLSRIPEISPEMTQMAMKIALSKIAAQGQPAEGQQPEANAPFTYAK